MKKQNNKSIKLHKATSNGCPLYRQHTQAIPVPTQIKKGSARNCRGNIEKFVRGLELKKDSIGSVHHTREDGIRLAVYRFTNQVIEDGKLERFVQLAEKRGIRYGRAKRINPYRAGFIVLCKNGQRSVNAGSRQKWSMELDYARLHNIPAQYLIGFLEQQGSKELIHARYRKLIARTSNNIKNLRQDEI